MIQPHRQRAGRTGNEDVTDLGDVLGLALQIAEAERDEASLSGAHLFERRQPLFAELVEQRLDLWMQWHRRNSSR